MQLMQKHSTSEISKTETQTKQYYSLIKSWLRR